MKRFGIQDWALIGTGLAAIVLAYYSAGASPSEATLNLASGYAMSVVFYFLLVVAPDFSKRRRVRRNLVRHYLELRHELVGLLLHAAREAWTFDEREVLSDPKAFTEYFSGEDGGAERWYAVLNGLDDYFVRQIAMHLEVFRDEIQFVLSTVDVRDEDLFGFLKRISQSIYLISKRSSDFDDVKAWGGFLWGILANWNPVDGELKEDPILKMLERI